MGSFNRTHYSLVTPASLFSKSYTKFENQMTHALLQFIDAAGYNFLLELTKGFSNPLPISLLTIEEQTSDKNNSENPRSYSSVPDGEISIKPIRVIIESKISPNDINPKQLDGHLELLKNTHYGQYHYLLYITPDICEPEELYNRPNVEWLSWIDVIDCVTSYAQTRPDLEYLSKAIRELSDSISYDHMVIPFDKKVLILAGRYAEQKAIEEKIYHCQKGRKFADCKYLAFYKDKRISHVFEFEKSQTPYVNDKGKEDDLYILKETDFNIKTPIINDKKRKNGEKERTIAYTMGSPRYVTLDAIRRATTTTQLDQMTKEYLTIKKQKNQPIK